MTEAISDILGQQTQKVGALAGFPKSPATREAFIRAASELCAQARERGVTLTQEQTSGLVTKLAKYSAKRQWQLAGVMAELPSIADAVSHQPARLSDPAITLQKILDNHRAWNQQAAASLRRELLANPNADQPPAVMAKSTDGTYRLVECVTQRHLRWSISTNRPLD